MDAESGAAVPAAEEPQRPEAAEASATTTGGSGDAAGDGEIVGVKVVVRVRRLLHHELAEGCQPCVLVEAEEAGSGVVPQQVVIQDKAFDFDRAFSPEVGQAPVYQQTARPLVDKFFAGFNATVLAYGQTGSGKTHTMGNTLALDQEATDSEGAGIIPRALRDIFARMEAERAVPPETRRAFRLQLSYLEIYREEARDLLLSSSSSASTGGESGSSSAPVLSIREDGAGITVAGLSLHEVGSLQAVSELLYRGALARATATTNMNAHSSRSHAVCTLHLESWREAEAASATARRTLSKFNLVDLAGSERAKRTGAQGDRLKEGIEINKGLLALGNVIAALTDPARKGTGHVPYRDAKITRLLQDSLGGSAFTCMIACVSPADSNADESVNTLRYAQRARSIQNVATQHSSSFAGAGEPSAEVLALRKELRLLQLQLAQARRGGDGGIGGGGGGGMAMTTGPGPSLAGATASGDASLIQVLREENGRLRASLQQVEGEARAAAEAGALNALLLETLRLRFEQLGALAKEAGLELPEGLLLLDDCGGASSSETAAAAMSMMMMGNVSPGTAATAAVVAASAVLGQQQQQQQQEEDEEKPRRRLECTDEEGPAVAPAALPGVEGEDGEGEGEGAAPAVEVAAAEALVTGELASLGLEIERKEAAVARLAREGQCFGQLRSFFEGTISRLQAEVQALQGESERLAAALAKRGAAGGGADSTGGSTGTGTGQLRAREKELERKVQELRSKTASYQRLMQLKGRAEEETRRLRGEIAAAKKRQGELMRRHREETKRLCGERRAKELEAVRLRRQEAKLKCDYEKALQVSARQEAVLRRKLEEVTAACKQHQETVRRLTEGSKATGRFKEGQPEGARQQQRLSDLRRHVQREMEDCRAYLAKRALLRQLLLRRAQLQLQLQLPQNDETPATATATAAAAATAASLTASISLLHKELQEAEAATARVGIIGGVGGSSGTGSSISISRGFPSSSSSGSSPAATADADDQASAAAAAATEEALLSEEPPAPALVGSTRRWADIKTLGEARHVLAFLFEAALAQAPSGGGGGGGSSGGGAPGNSEGDGQLQAAAAATAGALLAAVQQQQQQSADKTKKKARVEESEDEEEDHDWEESSSSEDEEEEGSDEEYLPEDSPSRAPRLARGKRGANNKQEPAAAAAAASGRGSGSTKRTSDGSGGSGQGGLGLGLEDEIDALLSDGEEDDENNKASASAGSPPSVASLEPLEKRTVAELKDCLKALGLPLTGRKDVLVQRLRDHAAGASAPTVTTSAPVEQAAKALEPAAAVVSDNKPAAAGPSSSSSSSIRAPLRNVSNDATILATTGKAPPSKATGVPLPVVKPRIPPTTASSRSTVTILPDQE